MTIWALFGAMTFFFLLFTQIPTANENRRILDLTFRSQDELF
jgi:hypothetical protein